MYLGGIMKKLVATLFTGLLIGLNALGCGAVDPDGGDEVEVIESPGATPTAWTYWACEGSDCGGYGHGVQYMCSVPSIDRPPCWVIKVTNICC
jgi:hypothetical protein